MSNPFTAIQKLRDSFIEWVGEEDGMSSLQLYTLIWTLSHSKDFRENFDTVVNAWQADFERDMREEHLRDAATHEEAVLRGEPCSTTTEYVGTPAEMELLDALLETDLSGEWPAPFNSQTPENRNVECELLSTLATNMFVSPATIQLFAAVAAENLDDMGETSDMRTTKRYLAGCLLAAAGKLLDSDATGPVFVSVGQQLIDENAG